MSQVLFFGAAKKIFALTAVFSFLIAAPVHAFDPGMPPLEESLAFKQFQRRVYSPLSVLIYLIDRYKEARIKIVYDGNYFDAVFAAGVAKWFLKARYKGETPEQWILRWCDTGIGSGKPIWVQDAYGGFKMSRDVLFDELKLLEAWRLRAHSQPPASQPV